MHRNNEPVLRLRAKEFEARGRALGLDSTRARADFIGISHSTVLRIVAGDIRPGEVFIARVLDAFPDVCFEDLFEVVRQRKNGKAA